MNRKVKKERYSNENDDSNENFQLSSKAQQHRIEPTIEAQIQNGDTLQALALRFHCTIADIKRLNKIDKDNEIFARKVIKVPVTAYSIILDTLPTVHRSGQSSPREQQKNGGSGQSNGVLKSDKLQEKLLVASVNSSEGKAGASINDIILNSKIKSDTYADRDGCDREAFTDCTSNISDPLLTIDNSAPRIRQIRAPTQTLFDWSGSDCDISWIVLLVCILILCIIIPSVIIGSSLHNSLSNHHNSSSDQQLHGPKKM